MKNFYVIGNNVSKSKSPLLFKYIFNKLNIYANYSYMEIQNFGDLDLFIKKKYNDISGFNITIPFKKSISKYCSEIDKSVSDLDSINCIAFTNSKIIGYNTDIYGFLNLLKINKVSIQDLNILVLGSGGSSYSIIHCINSLSPKNIYVLSRNKNTENELVSFFKLKNYSISSFNSSNKYDIIINTTPIGAQENLCIDILKNLYKSSLVIDINYINTNLSKSIFSKFSDCYISGIDMFIFQALSSLDIWFNQPLSKKLNYNELKQILNNE